MRVLGTGERLLGTPMDRARGLTDILRDRRLRAAFGRALPSFLLRSRWFGGKDRGLRSVRVREVLSLGRGPAALALVRVAYQGGGSQTISLPLTVVSGPAARRVPQAALVMPLALEDGAAALVDATADAAAVEQVLALLDRKEPSAPLAITRLPRYASLRGAGRLEGRAQGVDQSNTSIRYGQRLVLKLFRRLEPGQNPEFELGKAFAATGFSSVPPLAAAIEYAPPGGQRWTLAVVHGFVPNRGDG